MSEGTERGPGPLWLAHEHPADDGVECPVVGLVLTSFEIRVQWCETVGVLDADADLVDPAHPTALTTLHLGGQLHGEDGSWEDTEIDLQLVGNQPIAVIAATLLCAERLQEGFIQSVLAEVDDLARGEEDG